MHGMYDILSPQVHPIAPIYDLARNELTPKCAAVMKRIQDNPSAAGEILSANASVLPFIFAAAKQQQ